MSTATRDSGAPEPDALQFEEHSVHERLGYKSQPLNPGNFTWLSPPEDTSRLFRQLPDGAVVFHPFILALQFKKPRIQENPGHHGQSVKSITFKQVRNQHGIRPTTVCVQCILHDCHETLRVHTCYFTCNKNNPSTLKQYYFFLRTAFNNKQEFEISHGFGTAQKKLLTVPDRSTE